MLGHKIKIEDIDGKENGGHFASQVIEIKEEYFYPLCTAYSNWTLGEESGFVEGYKPVKVELKRF